MLVSGVKFDLNWFLQLILTIFVIVFGVLYLVKNTASKYFEVDANFEAPGGGRVGSSEDRGSIPMSGVPMDDTVCVVCGNSGSKKCSRCKVVRYCSQKCQEVHWKSGHGIKCKDLQRSRSANSPDLATAGRGFRASGVGAKSFSAISLVPCGVSKPIKQAKDILFPYDEFVKLFYWDRVKFPPCGLLNCGNSCFANVVLQCLSFTRPLVAYLLERGHRRECLRDDWCFLCEFQTHVERASQSSQPFSPNNIISRLPNIGGNLGYGRQEDAHEFMRFAIDTMQLVCLDEFGGEKSVHSRLQETTIIQHIFGGHLQSQVICTNCNNISNQYENMMDLTVEIHGDGASLEECLDQFTAKEWLHGDNLYKCDGCNDYVKASKCLTVKHTPNILTIALKRFQSGRFGKLNKKVTFPETLDLGPYMSETGDGTDIYKLYAVVVHVDMLNASFFGHYICYIKDFRGTWYRIDDCKVVIVDLEEVLSQGAYMILYSRVVPRSSSLLAIESSKTNQAHGTSLGMEDCLKEQECLTRVGSLNANYCPGSMLPNGNLHSVASIFSKGPSGIQSNSVEHFEKMDTVENGLSSSNMVSSSGTVPSYGTNLRNNAANDIDFPSSQMLGSLSEEGSSCNNDPQIMVLNHKSPGKDPAGRKSSCTLDSEDVPIEICGNGVDKFGSNYNSVRKYSEYMVSMSSSSSSSVAEDGIGVYANGNATAEELKYLDNGHDQVDETLSPRNQAQKLVSNGILWSPAENNKSKWNSLNQNYQMEDGNEGKRAELMSDS